MDVHLRYTQIANVKLLMTQQVCTSKNIFERYFVTPFTPTISPVNPSGCITNTDESGLLPPGELNKHSSPDQQKQGQQEMPTEVTDADADDGRTTIVYTIRLSHIPSAPKIRVASTRLDTNTSTVTPRSVQTKKRLRVGFPLPTRSMSGASGALCPASR